LARSNGSQKTDSSIRGFAFDFSSGFWLSFSSFAFSSGFWLLASGFWLLAFLPDPF